MTLRLTNRTDQEIPLPFLTAQRYDVVVLDAHGKEVWRWSADRMFAQVLGEERLKPGGALTYRARIPGILAPGRYTVRGVVPAAGASISTSVQITVQSP